MKKSYILSTMLFVSLLFAEEQRPVTSEIIASNDLPLSSSNIIDKEEEKVKIPSFWFLNVEATDPSTFTKVQLIPRVSLGRRFISEDGKKAVDVSFGGGKKIEERNEMRESIAIFTLPKIALINYLNNNKDSSPYLGLGASWMIYEKHKIIDGYRSEKDFIGIALHATAGFERARTSKIRSYAQIDVSQPVLAAEKEGSLPTPIIEMIVGIGF